MALQKASSIRQLISGKAILVLVALGGLSIADARMVRVHGANSSSATQGTASLDVEISGSGFDSSANVQFLVTGTSNPGGISVRNVRVRGRNELVATIDIARTAVVDRFDVQVILGNGRNGKRPAVFAVQARTDDACLAALDFPAFPVLAAAGSVWNFGNSTLLAARDLDDRE